MNFERREKGPRTFDEAIEAGISQALSLIRERFELAENEDDNLDFHNTHHTEAVIRRVKSILNAITEAEGSSPDKRGVLLGEYIAARHDAVQKYHIIEEADGAFTKKMRERFTIANEEESANEAIQDILKVHPAMLDKEEESLIRHGMHVTIPQYDKEHKTIAQPYLSRRTHMIARAVALADLGTAGMDGPEEFIPEGNAIFREENMDIREALRHPESISSEQKEYFRTRMLTWSTRQEQFAKGRKARLDGELEGLSEEAQDAVRGLFSKFDESIEGARAKTERRKEMSFEELVRDFGYEL